MAIDRIRENDLNACVQLHQIAFLSAPWCENWCYEDSVIRLTDIFKTPKFVGLLYQHQDQVVGAVFGHVEHMMDHKLYFLKEMFVHPEYKGNGIGREILDALKELLEEEGVSEIFLFTSSKNKTHLFYEHCGFVLDDDYRIMNQLL